jgi:peroxidase
MRGMLVAVVSALFLHAACVAEAQTLRVGYYNKTCPSAESIVFDEVQKASNLDKKTPAALLRLHFHDCFVNVS